MLQHLDTQDDSKDMTENTQKNQSDAINPRMVPLTIHAQYIKDLSFENPRAPQSLMPGLAMPGMDVNVTLDARKVDAIRPESTSYEVILHIEAKATREKNAIFIVELDYAVVASVANEVPEQHHHPLLMIEAPKLAFPFARQILSDLTSQAGFPPLLLNPVDFEGMYRDQYLAQARAANTSAA